MKTIIIVTNDNTEFKVPENVTKMSNVIKTMLDVSTDDSIIHLDNIDKNSFDKCLQYMTYHTQKNIELEKSLSTLTSEGVIMRKKQKCEQEDIEWDKQFINDISFSIDPNTTDLTIYKLIMSANFLDIWFEQPSKLIGNKSEKGITNCLVNLCASRIADRINKTKPEKLHEEFGIEQDMTPEEIQQMKIDYSWLF